VSRPLVDAFGAATDDLRGGAIADFGVSGWIAFLSGSAPDSAEDDPTLEFWADAGQIKVATATNKKAILHFIIGNLRFGCSVPASFINYNTFSFKGLPEGNLKKLHPVSPCSEAVAKRKAEWVNRGPLDGRN
jgi:hypothetical protein